MGKGACGAMVEEGGVTGHGEGGHAYEASWQIREETMRGQACEASWQVHRHRHTGLGCRCSPFDCPWGMASFNIKIRVRARARIRYKIRVRARARIRYTGVVDGSRTHAAVGRSLNGQIQGSNPVTIVCD